MAIPHEAKIFNIHGFIYVLHYPKMTCWVFDDESSDFTSLLMKREDAATWWLNRPGSVQLFQEYDDVWIKEAEIGYLKFITSTVANRKSHATRSARNMLQ